MADAQGLPTKEFFIGMLTRDIELNDAILDLLDNCLDGVVRIKGQSKKWNDQEYYSGYQAEITITNKSFTIKDNCGGIPRKVAEEKAFRMGRSITDDESLPTVGIYGIGMKRAIFKIGQEAFVKTKNDGKAYCVKIEKNWAAKESWDFPINEENGKILKEEGTVVNITEINPSIAGRWGKKDTFDNFIDELIRSIKTSYSLIMQKGFKIIVNGRIIEALPIQLLVSKGDKGIKPYMFKGEFGDVNVSLAIGFYAPPPSDDEIDENNELKRSSAGAGWTIVCNDRVVLYNDRSHLTGWGEAGIPHYHTQFIGIRGIVVFQSNNPQNLPMTTTKRGIDLSSSIYSAVKNKMQEGLKLFTNYTNQWKGRNTQEREYSTKTEKVSYTDLFENSSTMKDKYGIKLNGMKKETTFKPNLPKPPNDKNYVIIRFSKSKEDVEILSSYFFKDSSIPVKPSQVGEKCFDTVLKDANKGQGKK